MAFNRRDFLAASALSLGGLAIPGHGRAANTINLAQKFDVCVIGSGFAGVPLALRTSGNKLSTLMIEVGDAPGVDMLSASHTKSFGVRNSGEVEYPAESLRVIGLGGTSNHWGGVTTRLWPDDFKMRSTYGFSTDWPISYADLEHYYCQSEDFLQVRGYPPASAHSPQQPGERCSLPVELAVPKQLPSAQIGQQMRELYPFGRSKRNPEKSNSGPVRLADKEIPDFVSSPHASLLSNHQVFDIVTLNGNSIDHIKARDPNGRVVKIFAKHFVVANGAIEAPRLLLQSRSKWFPQGMGNNSDLVGRNFNIHTSFDTKFKVPGGHGLTRGQFRYLGLIPQYRRESLNGIHYQADISDEKSIRWRVQPEFDPDPSNRITISASERDAFGLFLPEVELTYTQRDKATIKLAKAFRKETRKAFGVEPDSGRNFKFYRAHPAGACRMGFTEKDGVVDAQNKVFGIDNLFVSGACTFTTSGTSNPTGPLVALTLRLADHLVKLQKSRNG
jgi:choline dehydrogenase-like flavoprotein